MARILPTGRRGLGSGAIYGALALALVLIHRATGDQLRAGRDGDVHDLHRLDADENHGWSYWPAFVADARSLPSCSASGAAGRDPPVHTSVLTVVIMTIGLVLTFNGLAA